MELSSTYQLSSLAENFHLRHRSQDEAPTLIREGLHLPFFAVGHLPGVDHHPEAMADLIEAILTRTDHALCRGHVHPGNIEVHTEAAQDRTPPDHDHHREDVEVEDEITLEGTVRDGEAQATAAIAVTMIEVEAEVVEEEVVGGVNVWSSYSVYRRWD